MASVPHRHRQYALWRRRKDVDRKGGRNGVQRLLGTSEDLCHGAARKPASEKMWFVLEVKVEVARKNSK